MSVRSREANRWASAIENASFGVWDLDLRLDSVHYSPMWKERLGFPRVHSPDSSAFWRCRVHPDDFGAMFAALHAHLTGSSQTYEMEFRLRSNGSGYRTVSSRGRVVSRDEAGNALRMIGTMVDLTGRPASKANYGLAADSPGPPPRFACPPFHAALGVAPWRNVDDLHSRTSAPFRGADRRENELLVEQANDLLDLAFRQAGSAA